MKKLNLFWMALALMAAISVGCNNEDPMPDPVEPTGPTFALDAGTSSLGTEYVVDADTVNAAETFAVKLAAAEGTSPITRIEVRENGTAVDPSRIIFAGDSAQSNPNPVDNAASLDWEIIIATLKELDTYSYEIIITDSSQLSETVEFTITTVSPLNESTVMMQVLSNQGGPAGQGGLDVDTGTETGTNASFPDADIRDMGIDLSQPNASNWRQRINSINGTKLIAAGVDADYDEIITMEDIMVGFNTGTEITASTGSEVVAVGDLFFLESTDNQFYVLRVAEVNVVTTDNSDNYVFDVKGP